MSGLISSLKKLLADQISQFNAQDQILLSDYLKIDDN